MNLTPMGIQTQVAGLNQIDILFILNINKIHNSIDIPYNEFKHYIIHMNRFMFSKHIEIILQPK